MNFSELTSQKTTARDILKEEKGLPKRSKILIGVHLEEQEMTQKLLEGFAVLPANFVVFGASSPDKLSAKNISYEDSFDGFDIIGIDALLCNCTQVKLENILEVGVVPIVNEKNYLGKILTEFHPGRAEGNAYLFQDKSHWSAYYALIRYLENHKFPYDNRNLVKNVVGV